MINPYQLHGKMLRHLNNFVAQWVHHPKVWLKISISISHRLIQHADSKLRPIHWCRNPVNKVPEGADVIQVSVSEHMSLNLVLVFLQPGDIRCNVIDAWIVAARKQETHIHNDNLIVILNSVHVFTNAHFADTADWDNPQLRFAAASALWLHFGAKLLAAIAIIDRLIDRNINHVLRRPEINILARPPLRTKHLALASGGAI